MLITPTEYMILVISIINPFAHVKNDEFKDIKKIVIAMIILAVITTLISYSTNLIISEKFISYFIITVGIILLLKGAYNIIKTDNNYEDIKQHYLLKLISPELLCTIAAASYSYANYIKINLVGINIAIAFITGIVLLSSSYVSKKPSDIMSNLISKLMGIIMIYYGVVFLAANLGKLIIIK